MVSNCGRHLGMMPHPERSFAKWQWPYLGDLKLRKYQTGSPWNKLFQNGFDWCLKIR